jgi:hypothetical protein
MADGAQVDGIVFSQFFKNAVGQDFAGPFISFAAQVVIASLKPNLSAAALITFTPSARTSGPVPSPGTRAILYVFAIDDFLLNYFLSYNPHAQ